MDAFIGKDIGNYRVLLRLAEGGMGVVYVGKHREIGESVAIKILNRSLADDPLLLERAKREASAVHMISGDGVVKTRDIGTLPDGTTYIVMELLSGESLSARLKHEGGRLSLDVALQIILQIAQTMALVHDKGLVHRDIKPENIFLMASPHGHEKKIRTKILDFGIVKLGNTSTKDASTEEKAKVTAVGAIVGTFPYTAPEQIFNARDLNGKADVYSLGIMLFQMLAGQFPFSETEPIALAIWHTQTIPPPLSQFVDKLPVRANELVASMLAKSPAARPSMAEVARISQLLLDNGIAAKLPPPSWIVLGFGGVVAAMSTWLLLYREPTNQRVRHAGPPDGISTSYRSPASVPVDGLPDLQIVPGSVVCQLRTNPTGASVKRKSDGHLLGQTPLTGISISDGRAMEISIQLAGYVSESKTLTQNGCQSNEEIQLQRAKTLPQNNKSERRKDRREHGISDSTPKALPTVKMDWHSISPN